MTAIANTKLTKDIFGSRENPDMTQMKSVQESQNATLAVLLEADFTAWGALLKLMHPQESNYVGFEG